MILKRWGKIANTSNASLSAFGDDFKRDAAARLLKQDALADSGQNCFGTGRPVIGWVNGISLVASPPARMAA
jgi:hypothetical protein